jgi:hypothetical protein
MIKRFASVLSLCCALVLPSCTLDAGFGSARSAPVLNGAIQVGIPPGYCIDSKTSRAGKDSAVILMGRCSDAVLAKPALITVSIGKSGSAGVMTAEGAALAAFFTSTQGRAALSRRGRAADVTVMSALSSGDAFLLHINDRALGEYWRAVVGINGRLVTLSATGTETVPLSPADGRTLIDATLKALRAANKGTP